LDRAEAIRRFVKQNLKVLLQTKDFPEELYKSTKRQYFIEQLHNDVGRPRDADIAHEAIMYLFRTRQIDSKKRLDDMLSLPFFAQHILERELYDQHLQVNILGQSETSIDLGAIAKEDVRQQVEKEITERIKADQLEVEKQNIERYRSQSLKEIEREIEERRRELEAYPSILDEEEETQPQPVSIKPEIEQPWWSRLGLISDPFPSTLGLSKISKEIYEKVVYKDALLQRYLSYARGLQSELFKSTIFFGQFGSGKTTFFEYLNTVAFPLRRIHGIYIQLYGEPDVHSLRISFQNKLIDELSDLYESLKGANPRASILSPSFPPDKKIATLIEELSGREPGHFIIFVDDLHKNREISVAMDFLSLLQTFETELVRRQSNLSFAFYVAGSMEWESAIRSEKARLSGSFSRHEILPPLTPEAAEEMFTRRFEAFSPDPENPPAIQKSMVNQIYRYLQNNSLPITYREFINTAIGQFKSGRFEDWFNFFQIPEDQLSKIRSMIESRRELSSGLQRLLGECKDKPETRQRCIRAIIRTYLSNGLTEDDPYFRGHLFEFRQARKCGLLRLQFVDEKHESTRWVVCPELRDVNAGIRAQFNLSLEDYLPQLYGTTVLTTPAPETENEEVKQVRDFANSPTAPEQSREYLIDSSKLHAGILEGQEKLALKQVDPETLMKSCRDSLVLITKVALAAQAIDYARSSEEEVISWWLDSWYPLEDVTEFLNIEKDHRGKAEQRAARACSAYRQAYPAIFNFVKWQCDNARYLAIPLKDLTNDDVRVMNDIRDLLARQNYFSAAEKITVLIEQRLRHFLFNVFRLLYGDDRGLRMRRLGKISHKEVLDNMNRDQQDGFAVGENEFEHLNRKSYRLFLVPGNQSEPIANQNWSEVFEPVFYSMSKEDVADFFDKFAKVDIRTDHGKEESIGPEQQSYISHYVQRALEILVKLNRTYLRLIQPTTIVSSDHGTDRTVVHSRIYRGQVPNEFYFSFYKFRDRDFLKPIIVDLDTANRLSDLLCEKKRIDVDLENWRFIEEYYGIPYRVFFAFLSACLNPETSDLSEQMRLTVVQTRGSRVSLSAERVVRIRTKDGQRLVPNGELKNYLENRQRE
jgi:hypothetical protein